ncbi:hypothetical protein HDU83_007021 [Entophlyctis luteolus]|nr:hypothetical protein HDU83_007021 [Entophlyctis luteolus]
MDIEFDASWSSASDDSDSFYSLAPAPSTTASVGARKRASRVTFASAASVSESRYELAMIPKYYPEDDDNTSTLSIDEKVLTHHHDMHPVLFQPLASGVSLFSQSARLSLAVTGAVSNTVLSTARWSTAMTISIGRSILVGALSSARLFRSDTTIKAVTDAFSLAELFTYGTWHLADSSMRFSLTAATETIQILDGIFGSTETSRAISSIVALIQDEIRQSILESTIDSNKTSLSVSAAILGTLSTITVLGGVAKALTAFACLQTVTFRRALAARRSVEKLFDEVVQFNAATDTQGRWDRERASYNGEMDARLGLDSDAVPFRPIPRDHEIPGLARIQELPDDDIVTLDDAKAFVFESGLQGRDVQVLETAESFIKAGAATGVTAVGAFPNISASARNDVVDRDFLDNISKDFAGKEMDRLVDDFEKSSLADSLEAGPSSKSGGKAWTFFKSLQKKAKNVTEVPKVQVLPDENVKKEGFKLAKFPKPSKGKEKVVTKRQSVITAFDQVVNSKFRYGSRFTQDFLSSSEYLNFTTSVVPDDPHTYKQYPLPHLLRNFERYMRFCSACYGADFMKLTGVGSVRDIHMSDDSIHANHIAFAIHSGISVQDILLSSYMDSADFANASSSQKPAMDTVVHYVAIDRTAKVVVVALRGTLALNDVLTDLKFDYASFMGHKVHSGMLRSAAMLYRKGSPLRETVRVALEENPTFGLVLTGHSLGGGVAVLLAYRWSCRTTELGIHPKSPFHPPTAFVTSGRGGFPRGRPIHCFAYGSPCVVSLDMSVSCKGLVSTLINRDDIVPTLSVGLVRDMKAMTMAMLDAGNRGLSERIIWKMMGFQVSHIGTSANKEREDYFWEVSSKLRESMQNERLFVAGLSYWMSSSEIVTTEADKQVLSWHVILEKINDVREMSQEPRFSSRLISDHIPTFYEQTLDALNHGVFGA